MLRRALVTGISGQDGSYLAELLITLGYEVHGVVRRASSTNLHRIQHLIGLVTLHYGDMTDSSRIRHILSLVRPTEVYNLAGQSDVPMSFECPAYTAEVNAIGALHVLDAVRSSGLDKVCRIYQASTSELFGQVQETPQKVTTPFHPRSPYGVAKLFAHWTVVNYREAYGGYACNGILFNHESPRRGVEFVTQKIVRGVVSVLDGSDEPLVLGNLASKRDWGHAKDYVRAMWMMLQQPEPQDFVICTGVQCSVRDFVSKAFKFVGLDVIWQGEGNNERGLVNGKTVVEVDAKHFRPAEVDSLVGCPEAAWDILCWKPEYDLERLISDMMTSELARRRVAIPNTKGDLMGG